MKKNGNRLPLAWWTTLVMAVASFLLFVVGGFLDWPLPYLVIGCLLAFLALFFFWPKTYDITQSPRWVAGEEWVDWVIKLMAVASMVLGYFVGDQVRSSNYNEPAANRSPDQLSPEMEQKIRDRAQSPEIQQAVREGAEQQPKQPIGDPRLQKWLEDLKERSAKAKSADEPEARKEPVINGPTVK